MSECNSKVNIGRFYLERLVIRGALQVMAQLVVGKMRSNRANHVPPRGSTNGAGTDISTDSHVTEEEPTSDETLGGTTGWFVHDVQIRRIETQSSSWETISNQVDPQKLDWDQSFRQSKGGSQENTDNLITSMTFRLGCTASDFQRLTNLSDVGRN